MNTLFPNNGSANKKLTELENKIDNMSKDSYLIARDFDGLGKDITQLKAQINKINITQNNLKTRIEALTTRYNNLSTIIQKTIYTYKLEPVKISFNDENTYNEKMILYNKVTNKKYGNVKYAVVNFDGTLNELGKLTTITLLNDYTGETNFQFENEGVNEGNTLSVFKMSGTSLSEALPSLPGGGRRRKTRRPKTKRRRTNRKARKSRRHR